MKCPYCIKDSGITESDGSTSCLKMVDEKLTLNRDHAYFYQVQVQLHVCNLQYCDFVVWTCKDVFIERITPDEQFIRGIMESIEHVFVYGVLPELVGKWYTRKPVADSEGVVSEPSSSCTSAVVEDQEDYEKLWCFCNQPSFGTMINCENEECTIEWFHCDCLRIRSPPKGKWYCPSCVKLPQFSKKKQRRDRK